MLLCFKAGTALKIKIVSFFIASCHLAYLLVQHLCMYTSNTVQDCHAGNTFYECPRVSASAAATGCSLRLLVLG